MKRKCLFSETSFVFIYNLRQCLWSREKLLTREISQLVGLAKQILSEYRLGKICVAFQYLLMKALMYQSFSNSKRIYDFY